MLVPDEPRRYSEALYREGGWVPLTVHVLSRTLPPLEAPFPGG
jgi:hypothetical protein